MSKLPTTTPILTSLVTLPPSQEGTTLDIWKNWHAIHFSLFVCEVATHLQGATTIKRQFVCPAESPVTEQTGIVGCWECAGKVFRVFTCVSFSIGNKINVQSCRFYAEIKSIGKCYKYVSWKK